jgi:FHS family L-fucose permease-like MFS transporter
LPSHGDALGLPAGIGDSGLLARFDAPRLLAFSTACALCLYVFAFGGVSAGFAALGIGLFNSIMFPVIFTITLDRSSASEEATSGLLCTAIVGGAFLPLLVGAVADRAGYIAAFLVPAACYLVLWVFAVSAGRVVPGREAEAPVTH